MVFYSNYEQNYEQNIVYISHSIQDQFLGPGRNLLITSSIARLTCVDAALELGNLDVLELLVLYYFVFCISWQLNFNSYFLNSFSVLFFSFK